MAGTELAKYEAVITELDKVIEDYSPYEIQETTSRFMPVLRTARAVALMRKLLSPEIMDAMIIPLKDTSLGFKTDEQSRLDSGKKPYSSDVIRDAVIDGTLRGFSILGNEINIISGNFYGAKNGFARLVGQYPGLTDLIITPSVPRIVQGGAVIEFRATWRLNGVAMNLERKGNEAIVARLNSGQGADAALGKGFRKIYAAIYQMLTGSRHSIPEADIDDIDTEDLRVVNPQVITATPAAPALPPAPQVVVPNAPPPKVIAPRAPAPTPAPAPIAAAFAESFEDEATVPPVTATVMPATTPAQTQTDKVKEKVKRGRPKAIAAAPAPTAPAATPATPVAPAATPTAQVSPAPPVPAVPAPKPTPTQTSVAAPLGPPPTAPQPAPTAAQAPASAAPAEKPKRPPERQMAVDAVVALCGGERNTEAAQKMWPVIIREVFPDVKKEPSSFTGAEWLQVAEHAKAKLATKQAQPTPEPLEEMQELGEPEKPAETGPKPPETEQATVTVSTGIKKRTRDNGEVFYVIIDHTATEYATNSIEVARKGQTAFQDKHKATIVYHTDPNDDTMYHIDSVVETQEPAEEKAAPPTPVQ